MDRNTRARTAALHNVQQAYGSPGIDVGHCAPPVRRPQSGRCRRFMPRVSGLRLKAAGRRPSARAGRCEPTVGHGGQQQRSPQPATRCETEPGQRRAPASRRSSGGGGRWVLGGPARASASAVLSRRCCLLGAGDEHAVQPAVNVVVVPLVVVWRRPGELHVVQHVGKVKHVFQYG